jgi:hypothetical protein
LLCIKGYYLTTDKREKAFVENNSKRFNIGYSTFIPAKAIPPSNYYWILREEWFWCNGQGLKAGLIGGGIGALTGGITGGLIRGISDYRNGYDFWDGSRATDYVVPDKSTIDYDTKRIAKSYNEIRHSKHGR